MNRKRESQTGERRHPRPKHEKPAKARGRYTISAKLFAAAELFPLAASIEALAIQMMFVAFKL
jgi:hypothetical protein